MGTLDGFPNPPATLRCQLSWQAPHALSWEPWAGSGSQTPPALWLRRAKLGFAYAFVTGFHGPRQRYALVNSKAALMA